MTGNLDDQLRRLEAERQAEAARAAQVRSDHDRALREARTRLRVTGKEFSVRASGAAIPQSADEYDESYQVPIHKPVSFGRRKTIYEQRTRKRRRVHDYWEINAGQYYWTDEYSRFGHHLPVPGTAIFVHVDGRITADVQGEDLHPTDRFVWGLRRDPLERFDTPGVYERCVQEATDKIERLCAVYLLDRGVSPKAAPG
jgi:hypothetical protein